MLSVQSVRPASAEYLQAMDLYREAFPPYERYDEVLLEECVYGERGEMLVYYDEGQFCGFTFMSFGADCVYLAFLATCANVRNKGYGSQILTLLGERYTEKPLVLDVEPLDEAAENYAMRVRRVGFYERNGFKLTGYSIGEDGEYYTCLARGGEVLPGQFLNAVESITCGTVHLDTK